MKITKPYLKQLDKIGDMTVWEVDGDFVRAKIDEEFTNFAQHYILKCVPENEFWIDKEHSPDEHQYYIDHMLVEWRAMKNGQNKVDAIDLADKKEARERRKSDFFNTLDKTATKTESDILKKIHKQELNLENSGLKIWIVNGELVRDLLHMEFVEGGHDYVYPFVPAGEIWLDDDLDEADRKFVLLHEIHERFLMANGKTYEEAHRSASRIEHQTRIKPDLLNDFLEEEFRKNRTV
jgi:hypothetical protein